MFPSFLSLDVIKHRYAKFQVNTLYRLFLMIFVSDCLLRVSFDSSKLFVKYQLNTTCCVANLTNHGSRDSFSTFLSS